jgi:hypothetical protein
VGVHETADELDQLQALLDASAAAVGAHMAGIITPDRRLTATELVDRLRGMVLLVVSTVTADGRPLVGPVDGYFLHGSFHFSSGKESVRMRHLAARPAVSAAYVPGEALAVTVHGRAHLYDLHDANHPHLRRAMLDHYVPLQGAEFEKWLDELDGVAARIDADKLFTFHMG